jgi:hypothetical protein
VAADRQGLSRWCKLALPIPGLLLARCYLGPKASQITADRIKVFVSNALSGWMFDKNHLGTTPLAVRNSKVAMLIKFAAIHRARTTGIVRYLSREGELAINSLVTRLDKLAAEEAREIPSWADERRLKAFVDPERCRILGSHSGEFLESVRLVTRDLGIRMGPPSPVLPIHFCLRLLLRELVCEREPLSHPQIDRLNDEQLRRYLWAPYSGNSITPESGQVFNLCEALKWYCQRLLGLIDSPDATKVSKKDSPPPSRSKDANGRAGKRDITLLQRADGTLYKSVNFPTAEAYADITARRRQQLIKEHGPLRVVGKGQNRRITVKSLIEYCPPAEDAK